MLLLIFLATTVTNGKLVNNECSNLNPNVALSNILSLEDFVFKFLDDHRVGSVITTSTVTKHEFSSSDELSEF